MAEIHCQDWWVEPYLVYSTYLGSADDEQIPHHAKPIAITADGSIWIIVYLSNINAVFDFPLIDPIWSGTNSRAVLCRLSRSGELLMSTCIGGDDGTLSDTVYALCALQDGGIVLAGSTRSLTFPVVNPIQAVNAGWNDAFLIRIGPDGREIVFSTYFGGAWFEDGLCVAEGPDGGLWLAGYTDSSDLPLANPVQSSYKGNGDIFVAKFSADGNELLFSTYFGGYYSDYLNALEVSSDGSAYIAGGPAFGAGFPILNAFQPEPAGFEDSFIARFSQDGNPLLFSTFFGGAIGDGPEAATDLAIDTDGSFWIVGTTRTSDFPLVNPIQDHLASESSDCYVSHFTGDGQELLYSTYFGGTSWEDPYSITIAPSGVIIITGDGDCREGDFPTKNPPSPCFAGQYKDCFLTFLSPDGQELLCSFVIGGNNTDAEMSNALSTDCELWTVGWTFSSNFPSATRSILIRAKATTQIFSL